MGDWIPRTQLGKEVMEGKISSIDEIFASGKKIKESQIIDKLLPNVRNEVIFIGGSTGKGGGKKRTPTKRTARVHRSGRRYTISATVAVGNGNGYFGIGNGHAKGNREAIEKALENAKLKVMPAKRGCGSWECACSENHSVPFTTVGKSGSVRTVLLPAPKGIGLCVNDEAKKIMKLIGIRDVWSKSYGNTGSRINFTRALYNAFKEMNKTKIPEKEAPKGAEEKSNIKSIEGNPKDEGKLSFPAPEEEKI